MKNTLKTLSIFKIKLPRALVALCLLAATLTGCHSFTPKSTAQNQTQQLLDKTWVWKQTVYRNNMNVIPAKKKAFTITLKKNEQQNNYRLTGTTDCNTYNTIINIDGSMFTLSKYIMSTKMYCKDSQESDFHQMLEDAYAFEINSKGLLLIKLISDKGVIELY